MTCPACGSLVPAEPLLGALLICPTCLASLVLQDGGCRRAVATDTVTLSDQDLARLRKARKHYREAS